MFSANSCKARASNATQRKKGMKRTSKSVRCALNQGEISGRIAGRRNRRLMRQHAGKIIENRHDSKIFRCAEDEDRPFGQILEFPGGQWEFTFLFRLPALSDMFADVAGMF